MLLSEALTIPALMPFCMGMVVVFTVGTLGTVYAWRVNRSLVMPAATVIAVPGFIVVVCGLYFLSSWYTPGDFAWPLFSSAICHFASRDLELPLGLYLAYGCMLLAALVGLVQYVRHQRSCDIPTVMALIVIGMSVASVVYYNTLVGLAQGRFLFPGLVSYCGPGRTRFADLAG